eukprot:XP_001698650.1 predicted protein [Chlamydomonas reinhardtii]
MRPVDSSEDSSDDSSSDEDSDSDEDTGDSAEDSSEEGGDAPPGGRTKEGVSLQLQVDDASGRVAVRLVASEEAGDVEMREAETDSSPLTSSSSSDDEEEAAAATSRMVDDEELEALDHDGLRDLITRAYAVADAEDGDDEEGGGGGGGGGRSALQDLVRVAAAWWQHGHSRDYQRCLIRVLSRSCPGLQQPLALMLCVPAPAHTAGPAH